MSVTALKLQLKTVLQQLFASQKELEASQQELCASRLQLGAAQEELEASQQELCASRQQLNAAQEELGESQQELCATRLQLGAAQEELVASQQELCASREQLGASQLEIEAARQQLGASQEELGASRKELHVLQDRVDVSKQGLQSAEQYFDASQQLRADNRRSVAERSWDVVGAAMAGQQHQSLAATASTDDTRLVSDQRGGCSVSRLGLYHLPLSAPVGMVAVADLLLNSESGGLLPRSEADARAVHKTEVRAA